MPMESSCYLTVIMPAYNEEKYIYNNVRKTCNIIKEFCDSFEIIVVNDGSTDNTLYEIQRAEKENVCVKLISYADNCGKGHAIGEGVRAARGERIAFLDADLDISPVHLARYLDVMNKTNADIVIGSKMHKESILQYPLKRKVASFCYYLILKVLFRLNVKDTQTGLKLFKANIVKHLIEQVKTQKFAYDIEMLALANEMGCVIIEQPIELIFTRGQAFARIKIKDIIKMIKDTVSIFWWLKIKKSYQIACLKNQMIWEREDEENREEQI